MPTFAKLTAILNESSRVHTVCTEVPIGTQIQQQFACWLTAQSRRQQVYHAVIHPGRRCHVKCQHQDSFRGEVWFSKDYQRSLRNSRRNQPRQSSQEQSSQLDEWPQLSQLELTKLVAYGCNAETSPLVEDQSPACPVGQGFAAIHARVTVSSKRALLQAERRGISSCFEWSRTALRLYCRGQLPPKASGLPGAAAAAPVTPLLRLLRDVSY